MYQARNVEALLLYGLRIKAVLNLCKEDLPSYYLWRFVMHYLAEDMSYDLCNLNLFNNEKQKLILRKISEMIQNLVT